MRLRRVLVAGLLAAAAFSLPVVAGRPAPGLDQRAVALVSPLPSLGLPLPSLPLPPLPPLPSQELPTIGPMPTLPPPTLPPLASQPPPLPTLPVAPVTPAPTPPATVGPAPSTTPPTGAEASTVPASSDRAVPPVLTSDPPAGGGPPIASGGPPIAGQEQPGAAPLARAAFDGVVGPVVALGVSVLIALAVLLAQLLGGAAFVPVVRRTLGDLHVRRWAADPSAPAAETAPPGGDAGPS